MKYISLIIIGYFFIAIFQGCILSSENNISGTCDTISIDVRNSQEILLSDFVESIVYIPLETTLQSVVSAVDKIYTYKNEIFILDKKQGIIIIFSEEGNYKRKIDHRGKGPGEYTGIDDFSIDKNSGTILISDTNSKKLHLYNIEGKFIESIESNSYNTFCELYKNKVISYSDNLQLEKYNLHIIDRITGKKIDYLTIDKNLKDFQSQTGGQFMLNHLGDILFKESLSYNIFKLDSLGLKKYYYLDFGDFKLPNNYFINSQLSFNELIYNLNDGRYAVYPTIFLENSEIIYFSYKYKNYENVIYNKNTKQLKNGIIKDNMNNLFFVFPLYINNNAFYSAIEPFHILNTLRYLKNSKDSLQWESINNIKENSILFNIKVSDNPIIIKYQLK